MTGRYSPSRQCSAFRLSIQRVACPTGLPFSLVYSTHPLLCCTWVVAMVARGVASCVVGYSSVNCVQEVRFSKATTANIPGAPMTAAPYTLLWSPVE